MGRKKVLEKRLARLRAKQTKLVERSQADDVEVAELRSINAQLEELKDDIAEVEEELEALDDGQEPEPGIQQRGQEPEPGIQQRGQQVNGGIVGNTVGSFTQQRDVSDQFATMEYRTAFKNYVQRGVPIPSELTQRAGGDPGPTLSTELGAIIPTTIMNEFIKEVSKVYGQIYSKVRKLNVKGGVKYPISELKGTFTWITETTVSERKKAGDIDKFIEFSYNIGEIRVSQTLLSQVVTLDLFESEITRIMVEAYVEAMDKAIISGSGVGQPLGVLKDTRVTGLEGHTITFTSAEIADWKKWRTKLFSKIPLSKRGKGEFVFTAGTVESNLLTMTDQNNRPVFKEATSLDVGESATSGKFYGREVTMVEPDIVSDFDTAESGNVIGLYWIPSDYAINTNLEFGMKRYFDEETNQWVNKGLTIVDGKMLDVSGCYILKKA